MTDHGDPDGTIDKSVLAATAEAGQLAQQGAFDAAEAVCRKALAAAPAHPELWKCLGAVRHHAGNPAGAAEAFDAAVRHAPDDAGAWASYGLILGMMDRVPDAADALRRAFALDPQHPTAGRNLGLLLMKAGRPGDAAAVYELLCRAEPRDAGLWGWLGHACAADDRMERAVQAYRTALEKQPEDGNLRLTLALAERDLGRIEDSDQNLERCLADAPDNPVATFALAQNRLLQGDYRRGFEGYEARWNRPGMAMPDYPFPTWAGEPIAGRRILLHDEQGLGDTIQFCRFALWLDRAGASVTLLVRPHLRRLLTGLGARIAVIDSLPEERFDYHCPLMSLPYRLGLGAEDIATDGPYLHPEPALLSEWSDRLAETRSGFSIGLVWQGDPQSQSEKGRSPPLDALQPLFDLSGVHFFLLQKHHGRDGVAALADRVNLHDLGDRLDTGPDAFVDTAAVMAQMDAVVTSDTGPAHLAGALGTPTYVLLKHVPEWRWGLGGTETTWYPSMTLVRQSVRGDWTGPVAQVLRMLGPLAQKRGAR